MERKDFNSYGSRRGNHEVMIRGTFANIRLRNQLRAGTEGGVTRDFTQPDGPVTSIYDASVNYAAADIPLVVLAGKEYGSGSSRDWAAKGTALLGRAGRDRRVLRADPPLEPDRHGRAAVAVPGGRDGGAWADGEEVFAITGVEALNDGKTPKTVQVAQGAADAIEFDAVVRIDTPGEADYYRHGGIMQYVLRNMLKSG